MKNHPEPSFSPGFTLAEVLIALALLGVIATFTIPKLLTDNQNGQYKSMALEVAGMLSESYQQYQVRNPGVDLANTTVNDLIPIMNTLERVTTGTIDDHPLGPNGVGGNPLDCSLAARICYRLPNGGVIASSTGTGFSTPVRPNGTVSEIHLVFDPNGRVGGPTGVGFFLYQTGKITSFGKCLPNTAVSATGSYSPSPDYDPPYFNWN